MAQAYDPRPAANAGAPAPLALQVAQLLRAEASRLPGTAAYVSPDGTQFVVCGSDQGVANYRAVAEIAAAIFRQVAERGGPHVDGRYVPLEQEPEPAWVVAFRHE